jgi:lysine 2,3-aminomutase
LGHHQQTLRTPGQLATSGLIAPEAADALQSVAERYAIAITPEIRNLIDVNDADDPIARQFVPDIRELERHPGENADPIGDGAKSPVPGLVHRYPDRVLLKVASVCPVYCRFCFRREMVGPDNGHAQTDTEFEAALAYIRGRPEIWEVILTGGDPLVLSPRRIGEITRRLGEIGHVKILRWHTRVPVVVPRLITPELIVALGASQQTVYVAVHANHPRELSDEARGALKRLADGGVTLVSQTVLLRGVNDDAETLETLMRAFVEARVKPYYLHHGDLAPGTHHLRTSIADGRALISELRRRLSGLALPTYVLDIPGGFGKVPAEAAHVSEPDRGGTHSVADASGQSHRYEDTCTTTETEPHTQHLPGTLASRMPTKRP